MRAGSSTIEHLQGYDANTLVKIDCKLADASAEQYRIIIIISPLQSTAGHRPLQLLAILLDLRLHASSSCQPSWANRHSTWPKGVLVLHYVYRDAVSMNLNECNTQLRKLKWDCSRRLEIMRNSAGTSPHASHRCRALLIQCSAGLMFKFYV
jgi:hypothetical protein